MDGQDVILWSGKALASKPFEFIFDNMHVKLKADPSYCLSVREGKVGDGSDIILWTCANVDEFLWTFSGDHILLDTDQHYCMNVREGKAQDGADIILWTCDDSISGRWV